MVALPTDDCVQELTCKEVLYNRIFMLLKVVPPAITLASEHYDLLDALVTQIGLQLFIFGFGFVPIELFR